MIAIVDSGCGNLRSIQNMLAKIQVESVITSDVRTVEAAEKLLLPGVGAFDNAMQNLRRLGLIGVLHRQALEKRVPILGICLGMQLFSKGSEEGCLPGLGWIDAETIRFRFEADCNLRIPHMGWDVIEAKRQCPLLKGLEADSRFYFVHSYHVRCSSESNILATTTYGIAFHSAVIQDNIVGTQFHPEKSHKYGMQLLKNFVSTTWST